MIFGSVGDVSVNLLSGFTATVDGVPVPPSAWRLKKARELVKLLALAPGHRTDYQRVLSRAPESQVVCVARKTALTGRQPETTRKPATLGRFRTAPLRPLAAQPV